MNNPLIAKLEAEEAAIMHELNVLKGAIENAGNIGSVRLAQLFHGAKDEIEIELKEIQSKARDAVAAFKGKVTGANVKPLASAKLQPKEEQAEDEEGGEPFSLAAAREAGYSEEAVEKMAAQYGVDYVPPAVPPVDTDNSESLAGKSMGVASAAAATSAEDAPKASGGILGRITGRG